MLSSKIIFECVEALMGPESRSDETMETLSAFLTVIGPVFDTPNWPRYEQLNDVFSKIKDLCKDKSTLSARIKCLLRDVLDARATNWRGRSKKNEPEGPVKLSEVARQAKREEMGQSQQSRPGAPREKEQRQTTDVDGWETVAVTRGKTQPTGGSSQAYGGGGGG